MNKVLSAREMAIARKVAFGEQQGWHPDAIDMARKYANLDEPALAIISDWVTAYDSVEGPPNVATRDAFIRFVQYVRTFTRGE